jgi:hypothetical protein
MIQKTLEELVEKLGIYPRPELKEMVEDSLGEDYIEWADFDQAVLNSPKLQFLMNSVSPIVPKSKPVKYREDIEYISTGSVLVWTGLEWCSNPMNCPPFMYGVAKAISIAQKGSSTAYWVFSPLARIKRIRRSYPHQTAKYLSSEAPLRIVDDYYSFKRNEVTF